MLEGTMCFNYYDEADHNHLLILEIYESLRDALKN